MKKLILIVFMLISIVLSASSFDKANNGYVKKAKHISLCASGFKRANPQDREEEVVVDILGFIGREWYIAIGADEGTILLGVFTLDSREENEEGLWFSGQGINKETGEEVKLVLNSDNNSVYLAFFALDEDDRADMQYDVFCVRKDNPQSFIIFNESDEKVPLHSWKKGTPKQLKMCLSQNPYRK